MKQTDSIEEFKNWELTELIPYTFNKVQNAKNRLCKRMSSEDVEDVTQDTLVFFTENKVKYENNIDFAKASIHLTVEFKVKQKCTSLKTTTETDDPSNYPVIEIEDREKNKKIKECIDKLTDDEKLLLDFLSDSLMKKERKQSGKPSISANEMVSIIFNRGQLNSGRVRNKLYDCLQNNGIQINRKMRNDKMSNSPDNLSSIKVEQYIAMTLRELVFNNQLSPDSRVLYLSNMIYEEHFHNTILAQLDLLEIKLYSVDDIGTQTYKIEPKIAATSYSENAYNKNTSRQGLKINKSLSIWKNPAFRTMAACFIIFIIGFVFYTQNQKAKLLRSLSRVEAKNDSLAEKVSKLNNEVKINSKIDLIDSINNHKINIDKSGPQIAKTDDDAFKDYIAFENNIAELNNEGSKGGKVPRDILDKVDKRMKSGSVGLNYSFNIPKELLDYNLHIRIFDNHGIGIQDIVLNNTFPSPKFRFQKAGKYYWGILDSNNNKLRLNKLQIE